MTQLITSVLASIIETTELLAWVWVQGIIQMSGTGLIRFVVSGMIQVSVYFGIAYTLYRSEGGYHDRH